MPRDGELIHHIPRSDGSAMLAPSLPPSLAPVVAALLRDGFCSASPGGFPVDLKAAATDTIERYRGTLGAIPPALVRELMKAWCLSLSRGCARFMPEGDVFEDFVDAAAETCAELPAFVFNRDTVIAGLKRFTAWPTVAEVHALLRAHTARFRLEMMALEWIAKPTPGDARHYSGTTQPVRPAPVRALPSSVAGAQPSRSLPPDLTAGERHVYIGKPVAPEHLAAMRAKHRLVKPNG